MNLTQSMGERGLFFIRVIIKMKKEDGDDDDDEEVEEEDEDEIMRMRILVLAMRMTIVGASGLFFIRLIIKMKRMAMMVMINVRRRMKILRMIAMMTTTMTMMTIHGDEHVFLHQVFSDILRIHIIQ